MARKQSINPQNDALLAELGMPGATVENPDGPIPSDTAKDPLEVAAPVKKPIVAQMDAKHSTTVGGKGYTVTVQGEYFASSPEFPNKKVSRNYSVKLNLPSLDRALSIIKNKMLGPKLQSIYKDYISFRTHEIVEARPLSPETPESTNLAYMSREKLLQYVKENNVPVDVADEVYTDVVLLRSAVVDYVLNPKGFEEREARRIVDHKETLELRKMNPEVAVTDAPTVEGK